MEDIRREDLEGAAEESQVQQAPATSSAYAWSPTTHQAALYGGLRLVATVVQAHFRGKQARKRVSRATTFASLTERIAQKRILMEPSDLICLGRFVRRRSPFASSRCRRSSRRSRSVL